MSRIHVHTHVHSDINGEINTGFSRNTSLSAIEANIKSLLLKIPKVILLLKAYIYYKWKIVNYSCSQALFFYYNGVNFASSTC